VNMKDTSYEQPVWSNTTSNEDTMYNTWNALMWLSTFEESRRGHICGRLI